MVIAKIVLDDLGCKTPDIKQWIQFAHESRWTEILCEYEKYFIPSKVIELGCITLIRNGEHGLGVGTVASDNILLTVHHRKGVTALPLNRLRLMQFDRLRQ